MQFETRRLILRTWQPSLDARHAMDIYGDEAVVKWIDAQGKDTSIRQVQMRLQRYLDNTKNIITGSWAVEQKDIGRVIGHVLLMHLPDLKKIKPSKPLHTDLGGEPEWEPELNQQPNESLSIQYPDGYQPDYIEIGWHFRPASWGFGYATEAARCIVQYAFEQLNLPLLLAVTDPENKRSIAVIEKLGMRYDGLTARYYGGKLLALYILNANNCNIKGHSQSK